MEADGLFAVVALLWSNDGRVLATSRRGEPRDLGLPGGKIDAGETPEQALVRELREETGITALHMTPVFDYPNRVEDGEVRPCRCYLVQDWDGEAREMEPGIVVKWAKPVELTSPGCSFREYNALLFHALRRRADIALF